LSRLFLLDWKAVFLASWLPGLFWLVAVGGATLSGYPGVICVTPLGWLLALPVGTRLLAFTRSRAGGVRLIEAALAGALLGLFQGGLFGAIYSLDSTFNQANPGSLLALSATAGLGFFIVGGFGAAACSILAAIMAALVERRR
jgi:hypothetical protein